jgi:hypothetical protein
VTRRSGELRFGLTGLSHGIAARHARRMPEAHFNDWIAERYEILWPELFDRAVVDPTVDFLARLAGAGPALELGIGYRPDCVAAQPARRSGAWD